MHSIRFGPGSKIHMHHSRFGKYKYNGGHKKKSIAKVKVQELAGKPESWIRGPLRG